MRLMVMSDLHLSKKPWQVRCALKMGADAAAVLLVGDLTNDGTPEQMELMQRCIRETLPDTPVLAVAGNHDYPHQPSPMLREGICDYPALQDWLLSQLPCPYLLDDSGAYAARMGEIEIIGLNCVSHWRRFKFPYGAQLAWLERHLDTSDARRHILLCHAPLSAHHPKRSDTRPYLSRDEHLQKIIDDHGGILFISGHTHISMESPVNCVEHDEARNNIYLSDGSTRPTTLLTEDGRPEEKAADGNVVQLVMDENRIRITAISARTSQPVLERAIPF